MGCLPRCTRPERALDWSAPVPSPERGTALPTTEEVTRMSVLKLQTIEPRTENSSALVLSITSSLSSTCCRNPS